MSGQTVMSEQPVMDDTLKTTIDNVMKELFDEYYTKDIKFHKLTKKYIADKDGWNTDEQYDIKPFGDFVENIFFGNIKVNIVQTICNHTDKFIGYVENIKQRVQNWDLINDYSEQLPDIRQISREWFYNKDFYNGWDDKTPEYKQAFILSLIIPELSIPYFYKCNDSYNYDDYPNADKINFGKYPRYTIVNLINYFKVLGEQQNNISDEKQQEKQKLYIYENYALHEDIIKEILGIEENKITKQIFKINEKNIYEILYHLLVENFGMKLSAINLYLLYGFYNYIISTTGGGGNQGGGGDTTPNANPNPNAGKEMSNAMSNVIIRF